MSNLRFTEDLPVAALPGSDGQNYVRVIPVNGNLRDATRQFPLPVSGDLLERISIRRGEVAGYSSVQKFGRNLDIGSASPEVIWDGGGYPYDFPAVAVSTPVVSTSTLDTSGGAGARVVEITGLDANYVVVVEEVELNGTTPVNTINEFLRIYRARVVQAGTTGVNQGDILITAPPARILAGEGQTNMAIYSVAAGHTGYVTAVQVDAANIVGAAYVSVTMKIRDGETGCINTKFHTELKTDGTSSVIRSFSAPIVLPPKTDVWFEASTSRNSTVVNVSFDMIIVGG